jgi:hypothetical protein
MGLSRTVEIDWMLPGIPPTGRPVEIVIVAIVQFEGDKLVHEHIYWDQAPALVQIGLLDRKVLPVVGAAAARGAGQDNAKQRARLEQELRGANLSPVRLHDSRYQGRQVQ